MFHAFDFELMEYLFYEKDANHHETDPSNFLGCAAPYKTLGLQLARYDTQQWRRSQQTLALCLNRTSTLPVEMHSHILTFTRPCATPAYFTDPASPLHHTSLHQLANSYAFKLEYNPRNINQRLLEVFMELLPPDKYHVFFIALLSNVNYTRYADRLAKQALHLLEKFPDLINHLHLDAVIIRVQYKHRDCPPHVWKLLDRISAAGTSPLCRLVQSKKTPPQLAIPP